MTSALISIIIPTYNREHLISKAIDSVIAQTYSHWELIVVDDGSSDNSIELLDSYTKREERISYYQRGRQPKGAPTCRNIGLGHAKGAYIIFLDSDDYLLPFCLEQRVSQIKKHPDHDFLVFPMGEIRKGEIIKREIPVCENYLEPFLSANILWQTTCPIWKNGILIKLEGFTEGYPRFNDPELMIRAFLHKDIKYIVLNVAEFDSVHLPNQKITVEFRNKVYQSLLLFIPNIIKHLEEAGKLGFKTKLALYLHFWFRYIYKPVHVFDLKKSIILIFLFKKFRIISPLKSISLFLRLIVFTITYYLPSKPINKLSSKAVYLKNEKIG